MTDEALDRVLGQTTAIAMALTALMQHLPPAMAASVGTTLHAAADVQREADAQESTPSACVHVREELLDAWIGLLAGLAPPRA